MKHCRPLPAVETVKEFLDYSPETGVFTWRKRPSQNAQVGGRAGTLHPSGYWIIRLKGAAYRAHRLAFLIMTGREPREVIDHANGDKSDNRWCNIREVTQAENVWARPRKRAGGGSRFVGVEPSHSKSGRWCAYIGVNRKKLYLGCFDTDVEAHEAYERARREKHIIGARR